MASEESIWSRVLAFFAEKPIIGVLGSLASIAAIPLAIWLSFREIKEPRLTFSVQPGQLEVVRAGQSSGLSVRYRGQPVEGDVSVAKVALWNAGDAPIRERDDVRKEVVIVLRPTAPILKAAIVRAEPLEANIAIDTTQFERGRLPVHWEVLAKGEGAVLEILYNGPPASSFGVEGSILGQRGIAEYGNKIGYDSPEAEYRDLKRVNRNGQSIYPGLAILSIIGIAVTGLMVTRQEDRFARKILIVLMVILFLMAGLAMMGYYFTRPLEPQIGSGAHIPNNRKN